MMRSGTIFGGDNGVERPCDGLAQALLAGTLTNGAGEPTRTLVVLGAPCSGKTPFAYHTLLDGIRAFGDTRAVMTVSGRVAADALGNKAIRELGAVSQARPVTTMSALAFRAITAVRSAQGKALPRLLNGAEQDALLRTVVAEHIRHARSGDECPICALLREYFAQDAWSDMICDPVPQEGVRAAASTSEVSGRPASESTSLAMFTKGISDAFIIQLRDIISRINELGLRTQDEQPLIGRLHSIAGATGTSGAGMSPQARRLDVQWRLAFALRQEYAAAIERNYQGQYRLDPSMLLVEGALAVPVLDKTSFPELIVVDDAQDLTLAGLAFLEQAVTAGTRLLVVDDPDESVQAFRGSHPEYALRRLLASDGAFHAAVGALDKPAQDGYRNLVVSRVSLDIASDEQFDLSIPERPWKTAVIPGSYPIASINEQGVDGNTIDRTRDGSVSTRLYASPNEELETVVAAIKADHLNHGRAWNDMAVIAHDNATVRAFGERLRRDGVPVRYSSVTKPLKDEPFVQGLFALIELAQVRLRGADAVHDARFVGVPDSEATGPGQDDIARLAAFIRSRVRMVMGSPLITARRGREQSPARIEPVESAMQSLVSLSTVIRQQTDAHAGDAAADGQHHDAALLVLQQRWKSLQSALLQAQDTPAGDHAQQPDGDFDGESGVHVDQSGADEAASPLTLDAMYLLLACSHPLDMTGQMHGDVTDTDADVMLDMLGAVSRHDADIRAFATMWRNVGAIASHIAKLADTSPVYVLDAAWNECRVATTWQTAALINSQEGRAANDRLDTAMRLFDYASGSGAGDITAFFRIVRSMRIEADSLAKVAPIDQAITLTTPAGSGGRHWPLVWIVAVQQDVWPNLVPRNTMFGGEDLADLVLHGTIPSINRGSHRDDRLTTVLHSEQRSLLVALTRASERVTLSAVASDDLIPSDVLARYLPERFDTDQPAGTADAEQFASPETGEEHHIAPDIAGLCTDVRGLVAAARITLARNRGDSDRERHAREDAYHALQLLDDAGVSSADPRNWSFLTTAPVMPQPDGEAAAATATQPAGEPHENGTPSPANEVRLSPSSVDGLWACPVCWMMDHQFAGPRPGGVQASIGTIVHQIAQEASAAGLDHPDYHADMSADDRIVAIRDRMVARYRQLRVDPATVNNPADRYTLLYKDAQVATMLGNIASYFVKSNDNDYPQGNKRKPEDNIIAGVLDRAECEKEFDARFTLDDIAAAYNRIQSVHVPMTVKDISAIMGAMVDGWPEGMSEDLAIRLTGRIDREEHRHTDDGEQIRLLDYKTGTRPATKGVFNDLQLVCYQLGLAFPVQGDRLGDASQPLIAQSVLFHVHDAETPAASYAPESLYQPPLFRDGHMNAEPFHPRKGYPRPDRLYDYADISQPDTVSDELWEDFSRVTANTQIMWALAMIARVFYAGAAVRSERIVAHPQSTHLNYCTNRGICPACAGQIDTVFETRTA
ncbi:PD-(D/E)XK nuclease family protein [Bifidobacterium apri]|uniref:ATP-dependent DNA helicase, UvrD/REP family n=1 Tax=Bifidobacterium apri TaxID=1769423 RepID=A0A6A2VTV8_9BIFI|nr:PD-(D/E)XK nuclease family protein [Bifidobacterium apri]KAB8296549.1 ATP-dependent DNA helicase, UvrD/REP family [Bifidobacterium apri]